MSHKNTVQSQFGADKALDGYATSEVHARGESLGVLLELVSPKANWRMLDVATGAGHTALNFSPRVARVVATDITPGMLDKTAQLAAKRGIVNLETKIADAESLPFDDASFDLLTCRLAFHHFPEPRQALSEFNRVLERGGVLGFTDNIVIPNKQAAAYYNAYEKLRDPSHRWVYPLPRLERMFHEAGFTIQAAQQLSKEFEFHQWADRQSVSPADKEKLLEMMRHIPESLEPLFAPRWADGTMYFTLHEVVLVGRSQRD